MNIYCTKCGAKHEYTALATKPNFCCKCGNPFAGVAQAQISQAHKHEEVAEEQVKNIPIITNPKFSVSVENKKLTIEELRKQATVTSGFGRTRQNVSEAELKTFLSTLHAKDVQEKMDNPAPHGE